MLKEYFFVKIKKHFTLIKIPFAQTLSRNDSYSPRSALYKNKSFPLRISAVSVTKPQFPADVVTFTEEILNGKLHFLCSGDHSPNRLTLIHHHRFCALSYLPYLHSNLTIATDIYRTLLEH